MSFTSDIDLVQACAKGDRLAQRALYDRYGGVVLTICRRYQNNESDAADAFQEVFMRIYRKIGDFKNEGSLEGWLRRVAVTTCLNIIKKQRSVERPLVMIDDALGLQEDFDIHSHLEAESLMQHLQDLPEGYRTVFNLFAIEGFSHQEIATQLGIQEGTSRSQLTKARKMLQQLIQNTFKCLIA